MKKILAILICVLLLSYTYLAHASEQWHDFPEIHCPQNILDAAAKELENCKSIFLNFDEGNEWTDFAHAMQKGRVVLAGGYLEVGFFEEDIDRALEWKRNSYIDMTSSRNKWHFIVYIDGEPTMVESIWKDIEGDGTLSPSFTTTAGLLEKTILSYVKLVKEAGLEIVGETYVSNLGNDYQVMSDTTGGERATFSFGNLSGALYTGEQLISYQQELFREVKDWIESGSQNVGGLRGWESFNPDKHPSQSSMHTIQKPVVVILIVTAIAVVVVLGVAAIRRIQQRLK